MLLCRTVAIACNSDKTWAGNFCGQSVRSRPHTLQKFRYALPLHTMPPSFCLISSEAVLLTGEPHTLSKRHCEERSNPRLCRAKLLVS